MRRLRATRAVPGEAHHDYEDILDSLDDAVLVLDRAGVVLTVNQAAETLMGLSRTAAVGASLPALLPRAEALHVLASRCLESGLSCADPNVVVEGRRGGPAAVSVVCSPLTGRDGSAGGAVLALRDLSRLKALDADARRADRLGGWATLAAGIAHEVKNPLGGIKGAAQLLRDEIDGHAALEGYREYIEVMIREVGRIDRLLTELLTFSDPRPPRFEPVSLNVLLDRILLLQTTSEARGQVAIVKEFDPSLPDVHGDAEQLTQVFLNLVKNALEAMAGAGVLRVVSRLDTDYRIRSRDGRGDRRTQVVAVEICDSGPGISDEDQAKLFTPFFTTKGRGTGLGLVLSHRIVHAHRGTMAVTSAPGRGATFTTWLPVSAAALAGGGNG